MSNSTLLKLGAQKHDFRGPFFLINVLLEPLFHRIKNDSRLGGMSQLIILKPIDYLST